MDEPRRCEGCNCATSKVTHTEKRVNFWRGKKTMIVRRRRVCRFCGLSFFTVEHREEEIVSEPDGQPIAEDKPLPRRCSQGHLCYTWPCLECEAAEVKRRMRL
jgi:hypothetical protein